jgi:inhibitor of KinA sporulation pathway (predicted exonuclease)
MSRPRLDRLLVVDVEQTCWDGWPPYGVRPEIVELGIAEVVLGENPCIGKVWSRLIRPVRSEPSEFFTSLTGITALDLRKQGRSFTEVINSAKNEFGGRGKSWAAWGRDDRDIAIACLEHGVANPFSDSFTDLGHLWGQLTGAVKPCGVADALSSLGISWAGRRHRAGDDALNTAKIAIELTAIVRRSLPQLQAVEQIPLVPAP